MRDTDKIVGRQQIHTFCHSPKYHPTEKIMHTLGWPRFCVFMLTFDGLLVAEYSPWIEPLWCFPQQARDEREADWKQAYLGIQVGNRVICHIQHIMHVDFACFLLWFSQSYMAYYYYLP